MVPVDPSDVADQSPSRVAELIHEYQRKEEDWRSKTAQLAHLRSRVLSAGEHDAIRIVTAAGAEIRRVLLGARRDLLELTAQIDAVREVNEAQAGKHPELDAADEVTGREQTAIALASVESGNRLGILSAYEDLCEVVTEMQAALDRLHDDALALHASTRTPRLDRPAVEIPVSEPESIVARRVAAVEPALWRPRRSTAWVVGVVVAAGVVAFAGVAVYRRAGAKPVASATAAPGRAETTSTPATAPAPPAMPPPPQAEPWALLIEARRLAWIQATIDGRVETGRLFKPGETRRVTDAREVTLRVGDAGAVFVSTPTLAPTVMGGDGEVVTRRFAADGKNPQSQSAPPAAGAAATAGVARPKDMSASTVAAAASPAPADVQEARRELIELAQRWLKAYSQHDDPAMRLLATPDITISDARRAGEHPPAGPGDVRVTLEKITCQVVGDSAVLTGRMIEQAESGDDLAPHVSWISQTWLRATGQWHLADVRIISETNLQRH